MSERLWVPSKESALPSAMTAFQNAVSARTGRVFDHYTDLHAWSITHLDEAWQSIADFCGLSFTHPPEHVFVKGESMMESRWFVGAQLNYAQHCLSQPNDQLAVIAVNEVGQEQQLTYAELRAEVSRMSHYFQSLGIQEHDRIVGVLPNGIEAVVAMLATTSIGAIWSSCSPDFGVASLLDRLQQIQPQLLITALSHQYNGKVHQHHDTLQQLQQALPSLKQCVVVGDQHHEAHSLSHVVGWHEIPYNDQPIQFAPLPFDHPAFIVFSSGSTGKPKCIVHSAGGTLIQHLKELHLHTNLSAADRLLFYTTCGWMMWNWMVSALAVGTTLVLYDGCPQYPTADHVFRLVERYQVSVLGLGARLMDISQHLKLKLNETINFSSLTTLLTTGSPLNPPVFDYIYEHVKADLRVSSISGGTDIISCFALGHPDLPVYRGELQCLGLGMDVQVFNASGKRVEQSPGELVCCQPFPSMPIGFWNDNHNERYHAAYFDRYPNVWAHGDHAMTTEQGGLIILGRSDTTLNPGGVRIGTAEIYQCLTSLSAIIEACAVGYTVNQDEKIVLLVVLEKGVALDDTLKNTIKATIKERASSHHVPYRIIAVQDLPKTTSGKLAEKVVKHALQKKPIENLAALANPECLAEFEELNIK
ncbi:MAG: acetoacetate--CoA ligase [Coxiellaceae bacterium]|nr:acetoacetate--CoA ligase [Coxiellaceae bacterium]